MPPCSEDEPGGKKWRLTAPCRTTCGPQSDHGAYCHRVGVAVLGLGLVLASPPGGAEPPEAETATESEDAESGSQPQRHSRRAIHEPRTGIGCLVTGAVLVASTPIPAVAGANWARKQGAWGGVFQIFVGTAIAGSLFLTGGTLLVVGSVRHVRWRRWNDAHGPAVSLAPTRHGWAGGVSFRF